MPRLPPRTEVLRALFARSGNRCAFPGCTAALVNERNQFIGQVCHIEAAEAGGERYNPVQSDEERRSYENLLLLCYPHHVETNEVPLYSADRLRSMKSNHEKTCGQKPFQIDEALLHKVSAEMSEYWHQVDLLHREHHLASELAIEINAKASFIQVSEEARARIQDLSSIQNYLIESDQQRSRGTAEEGSSEHAWAGRPNDFEILYIGFTNTITKLRVALTQLELKYLEEFVKLNPADLSARHRLEACKAEFSEFAVRAGYVD